MIFIIIFLVIICGISTWAWARPPARPGEKRIIEHWLPGSGSGAGSYHRPQYRDENFVSDVKYEKESTKRKINLDVANEDREAMD